MLCFFDIFDSAQLDASQAVALGLRVFGLCPALGLVSLHHSAPLTCQREHVLSLKYYEASWFEAFLPRSLHRFGSSTSHSWHYIVMRCHEHSECATAAGMVSLHILAHQVIIWQCLLGVSFNCEALRVWCQYATGSFLAALRRRSLTMATWAVCHHFALLPASTNPCCCLVQISGGKK